MRAWRDAAQEREGTAMAVTTPATTARIAYHTTVREMPEAERPRERLLHYGPPALQTTELPAIILMTDMCYLAQEQLRVLCLDTKNFVVHVQTVYQGTVNSSVVRAAEVLRPAVTRNCLGIVVVHNHPSGDPTPSPEDVRTTEQLRKAGDLLEIELLDHVIVGQHKWVSLKKRGLGF
jgi:DNA repair protein RadC